MNQTTPEGAILIEEPLREVGAALAGVIKGHTTPTLTWMSDELIPGYNAYMEYGWIWEMPEPNPHIHEHTHDYDEFIIHIGTDPHDPQDLGAEIEFVVGDTTFVITKTSTLFIPQGLKHGPVIWKRVDRPHIQMGIFPTVGDMRKTNVGGYPVG